MRSTVRLGSTSIPCQPVRHAPRANPMSRLIVTLVTVTSFGSALAVGCGGSEPEPQAPAQAYPSQQYPQQQYPQQQYPQQQYPQQQYPQQQYPQQQYPQQQYPAAAPTGTMSKPADYAFPCQSDAQCVAHRCNVAAGKCAWPCQTNADCQPGFQCLSPQCVPALGAPAQ